MAQSLHIDQDEAVQAQLDHILRSRAFTRANRSQLFLRYIVERSLEDSTEPIKEYSIALDVFGRDASYDPSVDATVRVEAGRLRARLREYYAEEGCSDPVVIEVPKGGYRAVIQPRKRVESMSDAGSLATVEEGRPNAVRSARVLRVRWLVLMAFLLGIVLGYAAASH